MEQLAVIVWANVHIVMAGGKFAKVSHPGLVCAHRVWLGRPKWRGKVKASCAGTGGKWSLN